MEDDIKKLRPFVIFCRSLFIWAVLDRRYIAMYDRQISHAGRDAGADIVIRTPCSLSQGSLRCTRKTIYHGLGQFRPRRKGTD